MSTDTVSVADLQDDWGACCRAIVEHMDACQEAGGGCTMTQYLLSHCSEGRRLFAVEQAAWRTWSEARWAEHDR